MMKIEEIDFEALLAAMPKHPLDNRPMLYTDYMSRFLFDRHHHDISAEEWKFMEKVYKVADSLRDGHA